eukprot:gene6532-7564_t
MMTSYHGRAPFKPHESASALASILDNEHHHHGLYSSGSAPPLPPSHFTTSSSDEEECVKVNGVSSNDDVPSMSHGKTKKKRGKLPNEATSTLKKWLFEHNMHPYPTEEEKGVLAHSTSLSFSQINNWFTNARRRILPRQLDRKVFGSPLFSHFSMTHTQQQQQQQQLSNNNNNK